MDGKRFPMVAYNIVGSVITYISDPEVVHDMYNKHNKNIDKHPLTGEFFEAMFQDVFPLMRASQLWKDRRKAISHMFYKGRLEVMIDVTKEHLHKFCQKYLNEIKENGETKIDISTEFEKINAHTISHICFGEDKNDDLFDFLFYDVITDTFTEQKVTMGEAMTNVLKQSW